MKIDGGIVVLALGVLAFIVKVLFNRKNNEPSGIGPDVEAGYAAAEARREATEGKERAKMETRRRRIPVVDRWRDLLRRAKRPGGS